MNFGEIICTPFSYILSAVNAWTGSYLLALLAFTLVMKLVLFPLSIKQQKNSQRQAALRPKEEVIRAKYAGRTDKPTQQKMQQELMEMYQKEKFSPLSGCLPLLIQLPIILILYSIVRQPLTYTARYNADQVNALGKSIVLSERYNALAAAEDAKGGTFSVRRAPDGSLRFYNPQTGNTELVFDDNAGSFTFTPIDENGAALDDQKTTTPSRPYTEVNGRVALNEETTYIADIRDNVAHVEESYDALFGADTAKYGTAESLELTKRLPDFVFFDGAIDLGEKPTFTPVSWLLAIPVLTFITAFFGQTLSRRFTYQPQGQGSQSSMKLMNIVMPLFSVYITFIVPAAVAVYWIMQNCIAPFQQMLLAKMYPIPKMDEEQLKAARDEYLAKQKNKKEKGLPAPARRSLVYDDDEDIPEPEEEDEDENEAPQSAADETQKADETPIGKAQLKEDAPSKHRSDKKKK